MCNNFVPYFWVMVSLLVINLTRMISECSCFLLHKCNITSMEWIDFNLSGGATQFISIIVINPVFNRIWILCNHINRVSDCWFSKVHFVEIFFFFFSREQLAKRLSHFRMFGFCGHLFLNLTKIFIYTCYDMR